MTQNGSLSSKQRAGITALLSTKTVTEAAKSAGVGRRTIVRWLADKRFRAALLTAEGDVIDAATRRLLAMQDKALDVLEDLIGKTDVLNAQFRLRAAQTVLDHVLKLRELRGIDQRISDLEAEVAALEEPKR